MMHSGHYNAIRQASMMGDVLVVAIISDKEVAANKGPPIMTWDERAELIGQCKWVNEVVRLDSYNPMLEQLKTFNCDFATHGDDPVFNADGSDGYGPFKEAGKFRVFKRTEGVSTTDIVGRLLLLSKDK